MLSVASESPAEAMLLVVHLKAVKDRVPQDPPSSQALLLYVVQLCIFSLFQEVPSLRPCLPCRPPKVAFKWRHWGRMTGPLTCPLHNGLRMVAQPTNEVVSMIGVAFCSLNDKFQIQDLEVYFDQNEPMNSMVKVNGSPLGLPAKGKTPGGVELEMKPITTPVSPERKRAVTRTAGQPGSATEAQRRNVKAPLEKQFSTASDEFDSEATGKGILSSIWGLLGTKS